MTVVDRLNGINSGLGRKAPCRLATTGNITLSGLQAVDGEVTAEGDRVLVRAQTDQTKNGVYNASSGVWQRAKDFDGNRDIVSGTGLFIVEGETYGGSEFYVTSSSPIMIGTSDITFESAVSAALSAAYIAISASYTSTKSLVQLGAVGDAVTAENVTTINAAISSAYAAGTRRIDGMDKTYKFTGATGLVIPPGLELFGASFDFSGMNADAKGISCAGTLGTGVSITADMAVSGYIVSVGSTATFSENMPVYIKRNTNFHSFSSADIGEMNRVRKVVDSTHLWLFYPVTFAFPASDGSVVYPITTSRDPTVIRDIEMTGTNLSGHNQYGLYFNNLDGVEVRNVNSYKFDQVHCDFNRVLHPRGTRNSFRQSIGVLAYGYLSENGTRDLQVSGGDAAWMRHGSATGSGSPGGVQIDISIDGLHCFNMADAGIDFHGTTVGCYAKNCIVHGDMGQRDVEVTPDVSDGIISEGVNTRITNCVVKNIDGAGIKIQPLYDTVEFFGGGYGIIEDSYAENCGDEGFSVYLGNTGATINKAQIIRPIARGCDTKAASAAIRAYVSSGCTLDDLLIVSPRVDDAGAQGVMIRATGTGSIGQAAVFDPKVNNSAQADIYLYVDGGSVTDFVAKGGRLDGGGSANAQFYCLASSSGDIGAIDVSDMKLNNAARGLYIRSTGAGSTIGDATVSGVKSRSITGENIFAQADNSGSFSKVTFKGNNTDGGTYGLRSSGVASVYTDGMNDLGTHSTLQRSISSATTVRVGADIGISLVPTQATIAGGTATLTSTHSGHHAAIIDTEAAAATDDLTTFTLTNVVDGQTVTMRAYSSSRDVVVKDGSGNMRLNGDFTLDNHEDSITMQWSATDDYWFEIARSGNAA